MTVDAEVTDEDLADFGVTVAQIQSDVAIDELDITGTSKYVETVETFDMEKGHNFLALHFSSEDADKIEVSMDPTQGSGLVELDESGVILLQMKADKSQTVKAVATNDDGITVKNYTVSGMTFEQEG